MESPRTGRPVANQFVIVDDDKLTFQSYNSMIVEWNKKTNTITFGRDWNYSSTTSKYRNQFLEMYFPSIADTKKLKVMAEIAKEMDDRTFDYQIGAFIYTVKFE